MASAVIHPHAAQPKTSNHAVDWAEMAQKLEGLPATQRVEWAVSIFGDKLALSSSFGAQSAVALHLVTAVVPNIPVVLIDTGYLFPETYRFIDELAERLSLNLKVFRSPVSAAWQEARYGRLWEQGLDGIERYNQINKVEPMRRALAELGAQCWIAGLRRSQASTRGLLPVLSRQDGRFKLHPILDWSDRDIFQYLKKHGLPYHPLWDQGYASIGDVHTTRKLTGDMTPEETRFFGLKRECGLHEGATSDYSI